MEGCERLLLFVETKKEARTELELVVLNGEPSRDANDKTKLDRIKNV